MIPFIGRRPRTVFFITILSVLAVSCFYFALNLDGGDLSELGKIEKSVNSQYSRIRIRRDRNVRTLSFVRDNGDEVVESMVNLAKPYDLIVSYTKYMFTSYLFRPKQERVLIVGLGGGSMVHFLKHYDPKVKVDVVEIDPAVVKLADTDFGVRTAGNVEIFTKDAFDYLKTTSATYDVIYMDAFLKPKAGQTDPTGAILRLKTRQFYKDIQKKLTANGLVMFNINPHEDIVGDVRNIRDSFPQTYVFDLPNQAGLVVVGSMAEKRVDAGTLGDRAGDLDRRFETSYSYRDMMRRLER